MIKCIRAFSLYLLLCSGLGLAQNPDGSEVVNDDVRKQFADDLSVNTEKFAGNKDVLVRSGIVADRQNRRVEILAVGCGMEKGTPTEFFLIGPNGKEYEALALTMARAADVHRALEFIGVRPGRPVNYRDFQFWPKGERVNVFFEFEMQGKVLRIPAEQMILDLRTEKHLSLTGLMFVGSGLDEVDGEEVYLADSVGDIITNYNSPWTVLDVPYRAEQGAVYGSMVPNPEHLLGIRQRVKIILEPQLPMDQKGVLELLVTVTPEGEKTDGVSDLRFTLQRDEVTDLEKGSFKDFLDFVMEQTKSRKDLFVTLVFDDQCHVQALAELARLIRELVDREIIRIESHAQQLYYEAFLPNIQWLEPERRLVQPMELHLNVGPEGHRMRYFDEAFSAQGESRLIEKKFPFREPAELQELIDRRDSWDSRTILFYASPKTNYGLLRKFYLENREKFPIAYVFELGETKEK